jgi:hypothetical protein
LLIGKCAIVESNNSLIVAAQALGQPEYDVLYKKEEKKAD